jgi:hypothetical protein
MTLPSDARARVERIRLGGSPSGMTQERVDALRFIQTPGDALAFLGTYERARAEHVAAQARDAEESKS